MLRLIPVFIAAAVLLGGCSEECNQLSGSACGSRDCSFDTVRCTRYEPPNKAVKISYERTSAGREYTAIIMCELDGIEKVAGLRLEGQDFLDRCTIYSVDASWPNLVGIFCKFDSGGDQAGQELKGKCGFDFDSGTKATAEFCCTLDSADL